MELIPRAIRRRQDACGYTFLALYISSIIFHILIISQEVIRLGDSWYAVVLGALAVLAFLQLLTLSSNTITDIYAASMLGVEVFFSFMRPFLVSLDIMGKEVNSSILEIGVLFNFMALYLWGLLFVNCRFDRGVRIFLYLLPITYIINIMGYAGYLTIFADESSLGTWVVNHSVMPWIRIAMSLLLPYGYWKLSHSPYFAAHSVEVSDSLKLSPFNVYTLLYCLLALISIFPYKIIFG